MGAVVVCVLLSTYAGHGEEPLVGLAMRRTEPVLGSAAAVRWSMTAGAVSR